MVVQQKIMTVLLESKFLTLIIQNFQHKLLINVETFFLGWVEKNLESKITSSLVMLLFLKAWFKYIVLTKISSLFEH